MLARQYAIYYFGSNLYQRITNACSKVYYKASGYNDKTYLGHFINTSFSICSVIFLVTENSFVLRVPNSRMLRWNQHTCTISAGRLKTVDGQILVDFRTIILQDMFISV